MATLKADCITYGINYKTVQNRMCDGMGRWEALLKPLQHGGRKLERFRWNGKDMTYAELAVVRGVETGCMYKRIKRKGLHVAMATVAGPTTRSGYNG